MTTEELGSTLADLFGPAAQTIAPGSWQIEAPNFRLLVLLSEDETWLRVLVPIVPAQEAQPFLQQILEANFDTTQETRYALQQGLLWGVFQHSLLDLSEADLTAALGRLLHLHQQGLSPFFDQLVEERIRQIVQAAKRQGQSLETTLQTLNRFYQEGLMGGLGQTAADRDQVLASWRFQLERLWQEIDAGPQSPPDGDDRPE